MPYAVAITSPMVSVFKKQNMSKMTNENIFFKFRFK